MPGRPILSADVVGRAPRDDLRVVSPADFVVREWEAVSEPTGRYFVPYCLDTGRRRSVYVNSGDIEGLRRAKFQYLQLRERATMLLSVPWEEGRRVPGRPTGAIFAFSVGRCGSTVLVQALRRAGALALSEPDFYTQGVADHLFQAPLGRSHNELTQILKDLTGDLLAVLAEGTSGDALIKLRRECCKMPSVIIAAAGESPKTIFLIRAFKPWANSTLATSRRSGRWAVSAYVEGLRCLQWLKRNTECYVVTYEDLVSDSRTLQDVARVLGVAKCEVPARLPRGDSQVGTPLSRKRVSGQSPDDHRLEQALNTWIAMRPAGLLTELGLTDYC